MALPFDLHERQALVEQGLGTRIVTQSTRRFAKTEQRKIRGPAWPAHAREPEALFEEGQRGLVEPREADGKAAEKQRDGQRPRLAQVAPVAEALVQYPYGLIAIS